MVSFDLDFQKAIIDTNKKKNFRFTPLEFSDFVAAFKNNSGKQRFLKFRIISKLSSINVLILNIEIMRYSSLKIN